MDKVTWKTPAAKANAIASLKRRGYSSLPLRSGFYSEEKRQDEAARDIDGDLIMHLSQLLVGMRRVKVP